MAKDDVAICNQALFRIGVTTKIDSLTQKTKEAAVLNEVYEDVRDRVLAMAPWPFARHFAALQLSGDAPTTYAYRYDVPTDCLFVRNVIPPLPAGQPKEQYRIWIRHNRVPFAMELTGDDTKSICTDQEKATLEYTKRVTNPYLFNAMFTNAFAWALASEIALPLAKTIDHSRNALLMYQQTLAEATATAIQEEERGTERNKTLSGFERARL